MTWVKICSNSVGWVDGSKTVHRVVDQVVDDSFKGFPFTGPFVPSVLIHGDLASGARTFSRDGSGMT
jgi:hypothetical protein